MFNLTNRFLWQAVGWTFPLFIFGEFRLNLGFYHISIPSVLLLLIFVNYLFQQISSGDIYISITKKSYELMSICILFLLLHLFSSINSMMQILAIKEVLKLFIGIFSLYLFFLTFPNSFSFNKKFVKIISIASIIAFCLLIYQYAIVFKVPFLGNNINEVQRSGKNQLTYYIACTLPFALAYFKTDKNRFLSFISVFIFIITLVYSSSRSAWVAAFVGLLFYFFSGFKISKKRTNLIIKTITILSISTFGVYYILFNYFDTEFEVLYRFISIFAPDLIPDEYAYLGKNSYNVRGKTLQMAFNAFANYPLFGIGLSNTILFLDREWTHNDHVGALLQLGIIGYTIFVGIWVSIWRFISTSPNYFITNKSEFFIASKQSVITMLVLSFFIDVYTSTHFWFFIGLIIIPSKIAWFKAKQMGLN